jgi:hypothetical protein
MMLVRSGQKNLDEIQRIRVAMEGSGPVITGAQQELTVAEEWTGIAPHAIVVELYFILEP